MYNNSPSPEGAANRDGVSQANLEVLEVRNEFPEPLVTVVESQPCACAAISGSVVAKSLKPTSARFPEQYGHPSFLLIRSEVDVF